MQGAVAHIWSARATKRRNALKVAQIGTVGDLAEVRATRIHADGRKENFELALAITPDMVRSGGRFHNGAALTARGDRIRLTDFEREFIEYSVNEGGVLASSTSDGVVSPAEPVFHFAVITIGGREVGTSAT
ncbi:hypothetical protein BYI23_E002240 (plasmid) [Burkholderia sp. YI23]|nr:hypothetical protein BYI23_E002240 [Burkholderia sp. YI23]